MRTETVTRHLYAFGELSPEAKDRARDYFRELPDLWGWQNEWWDSAQAFERIAPVRVLRVDYGCGHADCAYTGEEDVGDLSGLRAWKWLHNNGWFDWAREETQGACSMTGFCGDAPFSDPIAALERTPASVPELRDLFCKCVHSWASAACSDYEDAYSDEGIERLLDCDFYEFDEDGNLA
jgi:hypothetical protein